MAPKKARKKVARRPKKTAKAKSAAKKKNTTKDRGPWTRSDGPKPRNWARIKADWFKSELTLDAFLRSRKIPRSTARLRLSLKEKNEFLEKSADAATSFRDRLASIVSKDDSRLHIQSLKHVTAAVQEILLDSAQAFKNASDEMPAEKAGRLTIAAGEMLLKTTGELQGIPDEDEIDGWPITRLFSPFRYQRDFIFDTPRAVRQEEGLSEHGTDDPFIFAFIGGRGAGKTYAGAQKAGQLAWLNRGHTGCVLAPTYPMLRDAAKAQFLKACTDKGLTFRHLKTENAVILFGDTKVYFRSMDDPDKVRGLNLAWAWLDEPGQLKTREAFDIVNGCIRGEDIKEPAMLLTTTPDGLNWLYDVVVTEADSNRARVYRARTKDNPTLGDFERRLRESYDPRFAAQELDAEFLNIFAGQAYWNFSPVENVFDPEELTLNPDLPLDVNCDFNVSPMAWNVSQDLKVNGDTYTYVFDEIHIDTAGTDITVAELLERYPLHRAGYRIWGDATGQHMTTSATRSDYEIIEQAIIEHGGVVEINIGRSNPRQSERVLSVNARLLTATGVRKFFVSKTCKYTLIDFERTGFIPGTRQLDKGQTASRSTGGKIKKASLTHHTDALGYKIFRMWPVRGAQVTQTR